MLAARGMSATFHGTSLRCLIECFAARWAQGGRRGAGQSEFWYNSPVLSGRRKPIPIGIKNAAKQSSLGMSEVSSATILMQRQAHTLARLSPYFAKGFSDSLKRDRREAVSFFGDCSEV